MWETWVQSLVWEDPLEEGMAVHSSILSWRIPMDKGAWRATLHGVTESDITEQLSIQYTWELLITLIYQNSLPIISSEALDSLFMPQ